MSLGHRDELVLDIRHLSEWLSFTAPPAVVVRLCGLGSLEQVTDAAKGLSSTGTASVLLARSQDVWPGLRTQHDDVHDGLTWMSSARDATGLSVGTDVANAHQVEACMAAGMDVLLISARVTRDLGLVREIATTLRGVGIPIMVENASDPDVGIWADALELLDRAGIRDLAAIHRGFLFLDDSATRYQPKWEIPIELMRMAPQLPVLCDLGSCTCSRELMKDIAQAALDLDMDGIVAQVRHRTFEPNGELGQDLTMRQLHTLLSRLEIRHTSPSSTASQNRIAELRKVVDRLDRDLLETLSQRQEIVDQIARLKKDEDVTVLQLQRWREIVNSRTGYGRRLGLDGEMVQAVFEVVHSHAIARQRSMLKNQSSESPPSE